ncbi:MAG: HAMP domain-containing histidine kinase [Ktedonobacteraceae bacterium]|nr:HAMP domain-containing histidine kinase [Ktedonobacteraceae bacterium]MBO0796134.1 HAMP domain-containing histidine kinase [Ktedonobacteraceae bacterium]
MATSESDLVKRLREAPINYTLLKVLHHELGNGLAVLSGYRHLLQRAISTQAQEAFPPTRDAWQSRTEQWSGYLQTMQSREMRLNNLLFQLRELSPNAIDEPLCQNFVRTDLVALLGQIIKQRIPLNPDHILQVTMPAQPLFIMCDPFWMEALLEHFLNYIIVKHTVSMPAEIYLEPISNHVGREAKLTLRFRSDLPELAPEKEEEFEAQLRALEWSETEVCIALCHEILHEHGGQIWSEQEGSISLALPLAD